MISTFLVSKVKKNTNTTTTTNTINESDTQTNTETNTNSTVVAPNDLSIPIVINNDRQTK